jgi:hypothetical protein
MFRLMVFKEESCKTVESGEFLPSQPCAYVNPYALLRLAPYHYY